MRSILFATLLVAMMAGNAVAAPLNLTVRYPLVTSDFLFAAYDADGALGGSAGLFTATAFTSNYNLGSGVVTLGILGSYSIEVIVDPTTGAGLSGSIEVTGDVDGDFSNEVLFKSSTLLQWGFSAEDKFEAIFMQESGSLLPAGVKIGTIIDARNISNFNGVDPFFTEDFFSDGMKADTFFVPLPLAAMIGIPAMGIVALRRRDRVDA